MTVSKTTISKTTVAKTKFSAPALPAPAAASAAEQTQADPVDAAAGAPAAAFASYEDAVSFGIDTFDALLKAGAVFARGFQDMGEVMAGLAQASVEETVTASRRMMGVRSLGDMLDVQAGLTRAGFDTVIEQGGRLSDLSVKMVEEALAPIGARLGAAVERMARPVG